MQLVGNEGMVVVDARTTAILGGSKGLASRASSLPVPGRAELLQLPPGHRAGPLPVFALVGVQSAQGGSVRELSLELLDQEVGRGDHTNALEGVHQGLGYSCLAECGGGLDYKDIVLVPVVTENLEGFLLDLPRI